MATKLTLSIDEKVVEKTKKYAKKANKSLSKIVEEYFIKISSPNEKREISPLVKKLSGIVSLPKSFDAKKEYGDYLTRKYNK